MKKTLLVTIDFWPKTGGVANYYFNLCRNLDAGRVVVLTTDDKQLTTRPTSPGRSPGGRADDLQLTTRPTSDGRSPGGLADGKQLSFKIYRKNLLVNFMWPKWVGMFWHIWRAVKKEKIEILWVGEVLPTGTIIYYLTKILKLPYIVSCHGNDILKAMKVGRRRKIAGKILAGAKYVTVNSKYTGELVKKMGVLGDKIRVVYPGVEHVNIKTFKHLNINNKERFFRQYDLAKKKVLLSVGRLVERKGFDKVIEAMGEVSKKIPEIVYIVGGDGEDRERLKHLSTKSLKHILFLGKVTDKEKWALMELCDVFVMTARQSKDDVEGFGIVYLEANSAGKPVIAGNAGGAREAVIDGETGLLVNPESIGEISDAIIKLFKNKELAEKLGRQGRERVDKEFGWEKRGELLRGLLVVD